MTLNIKIFGVLRLSTSLTCSHLYFWKKKSFSHSKFWLCPLILRPGPLLAPAPAAHFSNENNLRSLPSLCLQPLWPWKVKIEDACVEINLETTLPQLVCGVWNPNSHFSRKSRTINRWEMTLISTAANPSLNQLATPWGEGKLVLISGAKPSMNTQDSGSFSEISGFVFTS